MKRIESLDGLRGASIALVVLSHAGLGKIVPGGLGVTLFFFISGYIITRLLLQEHARYGSIDIPAFFARRAFRILPALLMYLLACSLYLFFYFSSIEPLHLLSAVFNVYNYYYIFVLDHGGPIGNHHPYAIVWSLAVEEHYYLAYPFLFAALISKPSQFRNWLILLSAASLALRFYLAWHIGTENLPAERIYKATDTRIDSIAFGAIFALTTAKSASGRMARILRGDLAFPCGAVLLLASLIFREQVFRETLRYTIQGIAIALIFSALIETKKPNRILTSSAATWLGSISYSLYLWHWLCLIVLENAWPRFMETVAGHIVFVAASLLAAHISHRYIETPALVLGRKWQERRTLSRSTPTQKVPE